MGNKLVVFLMAILLFVGGCSTHEEKRSPDFMGTIIDKKAGAILVADNVTQEDVKSKTVEQILSEKHPQAIWLSYKESDQLTTGQEVSVWIEGNIRESYPAQASAGRIVVNTQ